jgi:hypothetical protein
MEKIICKGSTTGGILIEITKEDGKIEKEHLRGVRCGLSWPTSISPAYLCLIGQKVASIPTGKYPLRVIKEGEAQTPGELFQKMFNEMGAFYASEIYTEIPFNTTEKNMNWVLAFDRCRKERNLQSVRLHRAPYFQDFTHGTLLIKEWLQEGALYIPKETAIHEQLRTIEKEDLQTNPEGRFYAVNALRYVVAAFETSICSPPTSITPPVIPPDAWT